MGIRIVGRQGRRMRAPIALARAVLYVIFPVGLLWCLVNRRSHSLQDVLLRTSVIYDWGAHQPVELELDAVPDPAA
jgi:uncharacterized RDD family membrane protein YckC